MLIPILGYRIFFIYVEYYFNVFYLLFNLFMKEKLLYTCIYLFLFNIFTFAQTDLDGIMMDKKMFCTGLVISQSKSTEYWEGTNLRTNLNLGTLTSNVYNFMGNYGISNKLNFIFNVPYISNNVSAGTLHKTQGIQDLSLFLKWLLLEKEIKNSIYSIYFVTGISTPLTNYIVDYLPLSIGLKSTNFLGRIILDYQYKKVFITGSETYINRQNIKIERDAYYTNQLYLTNEVALPNQNIVQVRLGYRTNSIIAELVLTDLKTLGGFDITKNNMPFPSNQMNATNVGTNFKINIPSVNGLSLIAGNNYTFSGRNVMKQNQYYGGVFYIINFHKK